MMERTNFTRFNEVVKAYCNQRPEYMIPILRKRLDYHLMTLWDAIQSGDDERRLKSIIYIKRVRQKLMEMEEL